jgi:hypothetical protein
MKKYWFFLFVAFAGNFVGVARSRADVFYDINGVTSDTAATDHFGLTSAENLIEGPGDGFDATSPHDRLSGDTWVTNAPNGTAGNYFNPTPSPAPRLVFDLGANVPLSEISIWGYADGNGNGASQVSLQFATDTDGVGGFGTSIAYNPTFYPTRPVTPRQSFAFASPVVARFVELTPEDNFFEDIAGGDRVGLGEVAFARYGEVITPIGATSNDVPGGDLYPVDHLIDGSGLSTAPTRENILAVTHATTGPSNSWVTDARNGGSGDFYANVNDPDPVLEFDLGDVFDVTSMVGWNYSIIGNAAKEITAEFFREGSPVGSPVSLTMQSGVNPVEELFFGDIYRADTIRLTVTDNYREAGAGGDRVGLAEVRFVGTLVPEPSTLVLAVFGLVGLIGCRRRKR